MKLERFKLEHYFSLHEFTARYLLCSSDCETLSIRELLEFEPGAAEAFQDLRLGYTEAPGHPELRKIIAGLYKNVGPEDVLVYAGAEEAIFLFMNALLAPGDHAIVTAPCYQSLKEIPRAVGADVSLWECREEHGWMPDLGELDRLARPNTKVLAINSPHNPTGMHLDRASFMRIAEWARDRKIVLFSDEVYRGLEYDPAHRLPAACELNPTAVSLGVLSKTYGLAGLRIGWTVTRNRAVHERLAEYKLYTTLCNSAPSEFLAMLALRHRERVANRNLEIIRSNLALLGPFFNRHADRLAWTPPKAGPIAFARLKSDNDSEAFCRRLLEAEGVLLLPGQVYDWGSRHFRIGFGRKNMPEALARFEAFLSRK